MHDVGYAMTPEIYELNCFDQKRSTALSGAYWSANYLLHRYNMRSRLVQCWKGSVVWRELAIKLSLF